MGKKRRKRPIKCLYAFGDSKSARRKRKRASYKKHTIQPKPCERKDVEAFEPVPLGRVKLVGLRLGRRFRAAARIAGIRNGFDQPQPLLETKLSGELMTFAQNLVLNGEKWAKQLMRHCPPWWFQIEGHRHYCRVYQLCPFCYAMRLVKATAGMVATTDQLNRGFPRRHYHLVAIRHTSFLHRNSTDEEITARIEWEISQRNYFMKGLPHYGAIWSTTLQPPLRVGKHWGPKRTSYELRTGALLLVPHKQPLPKRRKWPYKQWQPRVAGPSQFYQYSERLFRYPRRLLTNNWPIEAVRAARLMRGHRLHAEIKAKLPLL